MKKEYTQRTARLIGQDKVDELNTKKVLVFGVGGVGSAVVEALGRAGVGHLILVDADVFDVFCFLADRRQAKRFFFRA